MITFARLLPRGGISSLSVFTGFNNRTQCEHTFGLQTNGAHDSLLDNFLRAVFSLIFLIPFIVALVRASEVAQLIRALATGA